MPDIPDSIPANIAELLQKKLEEDAPLPGLPRPSFSRDHHSELSLLMVALAANASGPKPEPIHYITLTLSLVVAMHESHKRMLDRAVKDNASAEVVANLAQILAVLAMARFTVEQAHEFFRANFGVGCRSEQVSDQFLQSLGIERSNFNAWFDANFT